MTYWCFHVTNLEAALQAHTDDPDKALNIKEFLYSDAALQYKLRVDPDSPAPPEKSG